MKSHPLRTTLFIFLIAITPVFCFGQETPPHAVDAPIDAWLFALLGVGAVYGWVRMNKEQGR